MKLTFILLTIVAISASASGLSQTISFTGKEVTLGKIFTAVKQQTGYSFFYNKKLLKRAHPITVSVNEMPLKDFLTLMFSKQPLNFRIDDKTVVLSEKVMKPEIEVTNATALVAPLVAIRGRVVSNDGTPLAGASVKIKGSTVGTATGNDGSFVLSNVSENAILEISSVGYETVDIAIHRQDGGYTASAIKSNQASNIEVTGGSSLSFKITLNHAINDLNELVVVGFGTVKKRDLTGAVVSIKSDEITARPGPNPMESLQGRVAGLDITRTSGQPGAGVNLQLRGNRSITASGTPLFIINGLPGDYATLNPYDIESIDVLKDASSTAVYGSAGSNGVIIITTKSGKAGKLNVDFNTYYGYNGWSVTPKMRTGDAYLQTKRDAYKYLWDAAAGEWTRTGALWQSEADDETIFGTDRYAIYQDGDFVDWADEFLRKNAATQNYSLSVAGGTERTKGYISFNYTDEKGQYNGDEYKLFTTSMRIDHKIKDWVSIGGNLQASYVDRDKAQDKLENALVTDPLAKAYNDDGTINTELGNNVYNLLLNYQPGVYGNVDNNLKVFFNPYIEIRPIKGLTFLSRLGTTLNYSNTYRFDGIGSVGYTYNNAGIAKAQIDQDRFLGYQWENILTYNFKVAQDHEFTITGVSSWYDNQNTNTTMNQSGITSNNFKWYKFTGDVNTTSESSYTMSKTLGFIGRVNYSYLGKYLFSASLRRDGSSVLYEKNRWDDFPAASAGWRISEERFMDGTKDWLDNLKLRIGWGITGTASIPPYSSASIVESDNMSLGGEAQPIFRNSEYITNPALRWEKSHNTNIGVDATLLNNRIDLSVEYYVTKTDGVIYKVNSPIIYGAYIPGAQYKKNVNIAETDNKGFELSLNTRNIITRDFEWTSSIAFAHNKEKIVRLTGGAANNIANGDYTLTIGEPVNSFWNYKLDGIWQIGEEADAAAFGKRPGDLKVNVPGMTRVGEGVYTMVAADGTTQYYYNDLSEAQKFDPSLTAANKRYSYSSKDYQILGHNSPNWSLGFQNGFSYRNFDLTVYSYFRWGQMINYVMPGWYQPNGFATNASPSRTIPEYFNYWTPENPSNDFPVMNYQATSSSMSGFSGLNYVDGSFFKIKNITLGYNLPASLINKISIQKLRFYGTITNPLVVAKSHLLKEYDPEMNGELEYPLTKQVVVGLNVTF